jgi:hypothetical protein
MRISETLRMVINNRVIGLARGNRQELVEILLKLKAESILLNGTLAVSGDIFLIY